MERYRTGPGADVASFNAIMRPWLSGVSPGLRAAYKRQATNRFNRQRAENPENTFAAYLAKQGNFF